MVPRRRASTSVVIHPPPHPLQAAEPQESALGHWPPRLDQEEAATWSIGVQVRIVLVSYGHQQVPTDLHLGGHARGHNL